MRGFYPETAGGDSEPGCRLGAFMDH